MLIKAAAGGGGRGMKVAQTADDLDEACPDRPLGGQGRLRQRRVYMERYLQKPRHIEIQVIADSHGNVVHLGERDCSLQRRHQKVLEEAPSPATSTRKTRDAIGKTVGNAIKKLGYLGVGTIEFLYENGEFFFIEMNTRLQVEHPVTEMITGIDLVREQIRIAAGASCPSTQKDVAFSGHAIECRINAENPKTFAPSPGLITDFHAPGGLGVRLDSAVYAGYRVPPYYDSLIGKLIVHGRDREEALDAPEARAGRDGRRRRRHDHCRCIAVSWSNADILRRRLRHPLAGKLPEGTPRRNPRRQPQSLPRKARRAERVSRGFGPDDLLDCYRRGVFPMAEGPSTIRACSWSIPTSRGVLPLDVFHVSAQSRAARFARTASRSASTPPFAQVMDCCAAPAPGRTSTWINSPDPPALRRAAPHGACPHVECWLDDELVGGLYGVSLQGAFFGESMFSRATDASKVALVHLVARLKHGGFRLLDAQFVTRTLPVRHHGNQTRGFSGPAESALSVEGNFGDAASLAALSAAATRAVRRRPARPRADVLQLITQTS